MLEEFKRKRLEYELTIVFGNLEIVSSCFAYFSRNMGEEQYEPIGTQPVGRNRLFSQFHAQYPANEKERIIDDLITGRSKLRVIFATVAFGIGLDLKHIRHVIHIGVPYTIEEYFQEAGRGGRDGLPATAHIFYNSYDISSAKKNLSEIMKKYVSSPNCKREMILAHFGFTVPPRSGPDHECCDYHQKQCNCDDCVVSSIPVVFYSMDLNKTDQDHHQHELPISLIVDAKTRASIYEDLVNFRLTLPGIGKSCVGSTSLVTGITLQLIQDIVDNVSTLTCVEDIESTLPVFSHDIAVHVWSIIQKHML